MYETLEPITTEEEFDWWASIFRPAKESAETPKLWIWNWKGGGYNSCKAHSREEALKKGKEMASWRLGMEVDESTLRETTEEELEELWLARLASFSTGGTTTIS